MKLEFFRRDWVTVKNDAVKRLKTAEMKRLCVACMTALDSSRVIRGCHERCYKATVRAIARGDFTERDRIAEGKLLPPKPGGGRPSNPVTIEARS